MSWSISERLSGGLAKLMGRSNRAPQQASESVVLVERVGSGGGGGGGGGGGLEWMVRAQIPSHIGDGRQSSSRNSLLN